MNTEPPKDWPEVTDDAFREMMDTIEYTREYTRDGVGEVIVYRERSTGRDIGYEYADGRYVLHPGLLL